MSDETQPQKKKIRRGSGSIEKYYFDAETQRNIVLFQSSNDRGEKEKLYVRNILPAFEKLVENLICIYKFQGLYASHDELKSDCIVFLYETLNKFDASRGTKAFSYFNVVAKRWLITRSRKRVSNIQKIVSLDSIDPLGRQEYDKIDNMSEIAPHIDLTVPSQDDQIISLERPDFLMKILCEIREHLVNENEIKCIDSIITLFEKKEDLPFLNKRAVFTYIREMSGLTPKQLTMAISVIKRYYNGMKFND
jgi:hypothetical protein